KNGGVDRGNFGIPDSLSRVYVRPMVEESAVGGHLLPQELECGRDACARIAVGNVAAFLSDADGGQAESCRCDARRHVVGLRRAHVAAVPHQAGTGIRLIPKKLEVAFFDLLEKGIILRRKRGRITGFSVASAYCGRACGKSS